jgi:hypothetical protein
MLLFLLGILSNMFWFYMESCVQLGILSNMFDIIWNLVYNWGFCLICLILYKILWAIWAYVVVGAMVGGGYLRCLFWWELILNFWQACGDSTLEYFRQAVTLYIYMLLLFKSGVGFRLLTCSELLPNCAPYVDRSKVMVIRFPPCKVFILSSSQFEKRRSVIVAWGFIWYSICSLMLHSLTRVLYYQRWMRLIFIGWLMLGFILSVVNVIYFSVHLSQVGVLWLH